MMFLKSYCPSCNKAKQLFKSMNVKFVYIEMDIVKDGMEVHAALKEVAKHRTVPCIYINR